MLSLIVLHHHLYLLSLFITTSTSWLQPETSTSNISFPFLPGTAVIIIPKPDQKPSTSYRLHGTKPLARHCHSRLHQLSFHHHLKAIRSTLVNWLVLLSRLVMPYCPRGQILNYEKDSLRNRCLQNSWKCLKTRFVNYAFITWSYQLLFETFQLIGANKSILRRRNGLYKSWKEISACSVNDWLKYEFRSNLGKTFNLIGSTCQRSVNGPC